ncbi:MAG: hypothetical protein CSA38_03160 [Flavobacteriales bacterium]|nr:MAG: hypothetical protein CSA38_03160 [Flavobacteriales bacterium]
MKKILFLAVTLSLVTVSCEKNKTVESVEKTEVADTEKSMEKEDSLDVENQEMIQEAMKEAEPTEEVKK